MASENFFNTVFLFVSLLLSSSIFLPNSVLASKNYFQTRKSESTKATNERSFEMFSIDFDLSSFSVANVDVDDESDGVHPMRTEKMSKRCKDDFGKIMRADSVKAINEEIMNGTDAVFAGAFETCVSSLWDCFTVVGQGKCCNADVGVEWVRRAYLKTIERLHGEGNKIAKGGVTMTTISMTFKEINGERVALSARWSSATPQYVPESCTTSDWLVVDRYMSETCMADARNKRTHELENCLVTM
jgi:hypothetical protein